MKLFCKFVLCVGTKLVLYIDYCNYGRFIINYHLFVEKCSKAFNLNLILFNFESIKKGYLVLYIRTSNYGCYHVLFSPNLKLGKYSSGHKYP